MKNDVIAYCWNDALAGFTREDARRLTHVNLAFGLLKDGLLDLHLLKYLHLLPRLREWNPEMKIVLSVGGWGADGFSDMAMTEEGRRNFAKSCLDAVEKYNLVHFYVHLSSPFSPKCRSSWRLLSLPGLLIIR